jgi:NADH-quinone oxidoreductase subunit A
MSSINIDVFMPVIMFLIAAFLLFAGGIIITRILSPTKYEKYKNEAYECGELPVGDAWSAFNVRFYVVGLIFIIFDVESVLMFPVAAVFKKMSDLGHGNYMLAIFLDFIIVLTTGIVYCWKKGDLDWVKSYQISNSGTVTNKAEETKKDIA